MAENPQGRIGWCGRAFRCEPLEGGFLIGPLGTADLPRSKPCVPACSLSVHLPQCRVEVCDHVFQRRRSAGREFTSIDPLNNNRTQVHSGGYQWPDDTSPPSNQRDPTDTAGGPL